jgi:hypothetical protein
MRKTFMFTALVFSLCLPIFAAQNSEYEKARSYLDSRGELYFAIFPARLEDMKPYLNDISIDRIDGGYKVIAYANSAGFKKFVSSGIRYQVLVPPCFMTKITMSDYRDYLSRTGNKLGKTASSSTNWYKYPTYDAFVQIMDKFQTDFPAQTKLMELGTTAQGRKLLMLRVSGNAATTSGKPRFLYASTVHGDEVLNYMNTLHLIDTLLSNYTTVPRFKTLLDNIEIWFFPLYNPDGCYKGGNSTVQNAQRYNSNGVDINRNYGCPCGQTGNHAIYGLYDKREKESAALLSIWSRYTFHIATDLHAGTETVLWPYGSMSKRPCDEDWYSWVAKRYVAQAHKDAGNTTYFSSCGGDGIGNIYSELYECHGTSVDYAVFNVRGRMIPIETNITKLLPEADLQKYWNNNKEAILQFLELLLTGIQGTVKNSVTKAPIVAAKIQETAHDFDSAWTYTDSAGFYLRFIQKGTWNLTFSKSGFTPKTVAVSVTDYAQKYPLDVELDPITSVSDIAMPLNQSFKVLPSPSGVLLINNDPQRTIKVAIHAMNGSLVDRLSLKPGHKTIWPGGRQGKVTAQSGCYVAIVSGSAGEYATRIALNR